MQGEDNQPVIQQLGNIHANQSASQPDNIWYRFEWLHAALTHPNVNQNCQISFIIYPKKKIQKSEEQMNAWRMVSKNFDAANLKKKKKIKNTKTYLSLLKKTKILQRKFPSLLMKVLMHLVAENSQANQTREWS